MVGAGAFGTALAISLASNGQPTLLWGRDAAQMGAMAKARQNAQRLAGLRFPETLEVTADITKIPLKAVILLAVPTQALRATLIQHRHILHSHMLIACCKGVERGSGLLPLEVIADVLPSVRSAILTGPSFANDIAAGLPTALTLATKDVDAKTLQTLLSTPALRLYLSDDPIGAQLGGALKNVVAIAAGIAIGAGLGDSARAALMTRGFAEMVRFAVLRGAARDTLFGLSGFGDLVLTCTSTQSRNLRYGTAIGTGQTVSETATVEGVMTAHAIIESLLTNENDATDLPITRMVSAVLKEELNMAQAIESLLSRPLRRETDLA
ncbi:glycerol-3-phosphate dehydrogenase [NAD(P)+] [Cypionkella aquatica]|uniref:Glycerol-3-phosphate dehydrogenase [NAD(P)+] n=1 Tax=Cypionkella aquatica TaxID=1756042 RepID=A0AA37TV68_9RHOB|nr:glycerol-3-phosphate dehydrogenase [NAD(P)+] [Cypionkella aquatica]